MSLSREQREQTIKEFEKNTAMTELTREQIALDLGTTTEKLERIMQLASGSLEEPWIVRNYLIEKISDLGKEPVPFSALKGDHHMYWFLDAEKIDQKKID
ncbi:DUF2316 family protein [Enterococcus sp. BWR-S5]|uniref:DUF2316 family protein n=1 Tax=Enterococcus sp. BWR-S5 TaxID=2787714 RepID=UPI0019213FB5|nr:DUF2316 family protein [Enterococcus sp. BWR-S5]MBL1225735.1 DUF2316 family protein [Enterococcus sp. BWR-S5]